MHLRWADLLPKAVLACAIALALPAVATAATPMSLTGNASVAEDATKITYTVNCGTTGTAPLEAPNTGSLTVTVTPGPAPAATKDADYGDPSTTTVACTALTPAPTFDVPIVNDTLDEPNEKFTVNVSGTLLAEGAVDQSLTTAITDDDVPVARIAPFAAVVEGDAAHPTAQLTVTLSQTPVEAATIGYATENNSATGGSDYTSTTGELQIPAGQTTGTISVPILDDNEVEKPEAFFVNLTSGTNATLDSTKKQAGVAIFDTDKPPLPALSLPKAVTVREGNSGTVNALFTISLASPADQKVKVDWRTASFTATLTDYERGGGTVTFNPGQTEKTVSVDVKGDTRDEPNEAFGVVLGNPQGGAIAAGKSFGIITDDDGPTVGIGKPTLVKKRALVSIITCPKSADLCKGRLALTIGKLKAGGADFELATAKGDEVKVKLSRKARRALRKKARRITFTATTADASGAQAVTVKTFRVKRIR